MENRENFNDEDPGFDHLSASQQTPLRPDAFELSDEDKISKIETHFTEIMHTLGLDLTDDSLKGTPHRVAKMFVKEVFSGLNPKNRPHARSFSNHYNYNQMLVERNITLFSYCEHHFVPIVGKAHVAYIPNEHVVGLSKLNRIVQYYAKRPQVQERLTIQIAHELKKALKTDPKNGRLYYLLGKAEISQNQEEAACNHFAQAIKLGYEPAVLDLQGLCGSHNF